MRLTPPPRARAPPAARRRPRSEYSMAPEQAGSPTKEPRSCTAVHPFAANNEDELSFDAGDKIEVWRRTLVYFQYPQLSSVGP